MMGDGLAQQTLEDEIQQEEAPGSAIEMDIGRGGVVIGRQRNLNPSPVEIEGRTLDVPNDPDEPVAPTPSTRSCRAKDRRISPVPTTTIRSPSKQSSSAGGIRRCGAGAQAGGRVASAAPLPSARHEPASEAAEAFARGFDA